MWFKKKECSSYTYTRQNLSDAVAKGSVVVPVYSEKDIRKFIIGSRNIFHRKNTKTIKF